MFVVSAMPFLVSDGPENRMSMQIRGRLSELFTSNGIFMPLPDQGTFGEHCSSVDMSAIEEF